LRRSLASKEFPQQLPSRRGGHLHQQFGAAARQRESESIHGLHARAFIDRNAGKIAQPPLRPKTKLRWLRGDKIDSIRRRKPFRNLCVDMAGPEQSYCQKE